MTADPRAPRHILFLCTGNSARSILAEAIMNRLGQGRWRAWSAGSMPTGRVNPHALRLLESLGYETAGFRSKSWDAFARPGAPVFDLIVTVCDNAAGETCPVWPSSPARMHWGIADPAAVEGPPEAVAAAFAEAHRLLREKIARFLAAEVETNASAPATRAPA